MAEYVPIVALVLAAAIVWTSLRGAGFSVPARVQVGLFVSACLVGFGALLVMAVRAGWIVTVSESHVLLLKPPWVSLFFVLWAALLPIGLYSQGAVNTVAFLNSHWRLFYPLSWAFITLGAIGFIFVPRAVPISLRCDPEARTYKYTSGIPPFAYVRRGGLYDMLGIRVDEEHNRYIVRVSWRARNWKIDFGSFIDRDTANDLARRVSKAIGTSCWTANS